MNAQLDLEPTRPRQQRVRLARPLTNVVIDHAAALARRFAAALRRRRQRMRADSRGAYLSHAEDHADLERRQRAWDDYERDRLRWPPTL